MKTRNMPMCRVTHCSIVIIKNFFMRLMKMQMEIPDIYIPWYSLLSSEGVAKDRFRY